MARAEALGEDPWKRLERRPRYTARTGKVRRQRPYEKERIVRERGYVNERLNFEDVAEFEYNPLKCRETYRMVVVRKNISRMEGELCLVDELRYFLHVTTRRDLSADRVVRLANPRCDQENVIEQLKNGVNALRLPMYDLVSNWAYMVMAALAWNLKSWFAMMMHLKSDRRKYAAMEFKRFIREMIPLPCQVIRRARQTTLRIIGWQPTTDRLFSTWPTIERTTPALLLRRPCASTGTRVSRCQNHSRTTLDRVLKGSVHPLASLQNRLMQAARSALCQPAQPKLAARTLLACLGTSRRNDRSC